MLLSLSIAAFLLQSSTATAQPPTAQVATVYVPQRVYDTRRGAFTDFESMLADLSRADVLFVGEQHDDPNTHRLELALLEGLTRRRTPLVVGLEMFERDVQPLLDQYASGAIPEDRFLAGSRPWPRYATDYRPLVEFARVHQMTILASNVPRSIAAAVAKGGLSAIEAAGGDRALAAQDLQCPTSGAYYDRFIDQMGGHPAAAADASADEGHQRNDRYYLAQCVKDETMAESVSRAFDDTQARALIVHFNGAFHSDFAEGAAERARRRLPGRRVAVVSLLPIADIDAAQPDDDDQKRADYLIFTVK